MGEEGGDAMRIGKRCFVGNLAWRTSWQDLKDKFRECGNVVYANVTKDDTGAPPAARDARGAAASAKAARAGPAADAAPAAQ